MEVQKIGKEIKHPKSEKSVVIAETFMSSKNYCAHYGEKDAPIVKEEMKKTLTKSAIKGKKLKK